VQQAGDAELQGAEEAEHRRKEEPRGGAGEEEHYGIARRAVDRGPLLQLLRGGLWHGHGRCREQFTARGLVRARLAQGWLVRGPEPARAQGQWVRARLRELRISALRISALPAPPVSGKWATPAQRGSSRRVSRAIGRGL